MYAIVILCNRKGLIKSKKDMDLIIKPTQRCNFSCTYCSSTEIAVSNRKTDDLEVAKVIKFLTRFPDTTNIIVNGGDPLVVELNYYEEILEHIKAHNLGTSLHFCTNLWDFYKKPEKWKKLFLDKKVKVGTSFNFGESRQITPGRILTKNIFLDIIYKFEKEIGYKPDFIAVVTDENFETGIENVRLAKELGVQCKLNYEMKSGRSNKGLAIGKMYNLYLDIYQEGLAEFEFNTEQMIKKLRGEGPILCPQTRSCDEGIRNLQPTSESGYFYSSCGAFGDDQLYGIDFELEMSGGLETPLQKSPELQYQKEECLSCINFSICNGCYKTVRDHRESNLVEESCLQMKNFRNRLELENIK